MKINLHNAQISKIQTLADHSIQVRINMPEMPAEEMADLFRSLNNDVHTVEVDQPDGKTQAQRLRATLYKVFEQKKLEDEMAEQDFETFYRQETEKIINHYKSKLPKLA